HNGTVIFSAMDGTGDREPWITDGSTTQMLSNINPSGSSNPRLFTPAGDGFVFVANDGTNDLLYYTDGNPGSIILLDTRVNYIPYGQGNNSWQPQISSSILAILQARCTVSPSREVSLILRPPLMMSLSL
ncbi:MAG: hypothetical protein AAFR59_06825, partial [Bacteroidota bacterium]